MLLQTVSIMGRSINNFELRDADVVLRPKLDGIGSQTSPSAAARYRRGAQRPRPCCRRFASASKPKPAEPRADPMHHTVPTSRAIPTLPLRIFEVRYLQIISRCHKLGEPFGVVSLIEGAARRCQRDAQPRAEGFARERFHPVVPGGDPAFRTPAAWAVAHPLPGQSTSSV